MTEGLKKPRRWRLIVIAIAAVLVLGLGWVFFGAMSDKDGRIKVVLAMAKAREAQGAIATYLADKKVLPPDNNALRLPDKESRPYFTAFEEQADLSYAILVKDGTLTLTFAPGQEPVAGKTLIFVPTVVSGSLEWSCNTGTVDAKYRPAQCRGR